MSNVATRQYNPAIERQNVYSSSDWSLTNRLKQKKLGYKSEGALGPLLAKASFRSQKGTISQLSPIFTPPLSYSDEWATKTAASISDLLRYVDDWDDEGSAGVDETAVRRLIAFVRQLSARYGARVSKSNPLIYNGPNGSANIMWRNSTSSVRIVANPRASSVVSFVDKPGCLISPSSDEQVSIGRILDLLESN